MLCEETCETFSLFRLLIRLLINVFFLFRQGLLPAQLMQMSDDIVLNRNFVKCLLNTCQPKAQISRVHTHTVFLIY